jgi:hypothetical protein
MRLVYRRWRGFPTVAGVGGCHYGARDHPLRAPASDRSSDLEEKKSLADSSMEKILLQTVTAGNGSDIVKRAPFTKRGLNYDILIRHKKFSVPEIRGIQRKRYNEEIFLGVSGPD